MEGYLGEFKPGIKTRIENYLLMDKVGWSLVFITKYGGIDGAHHKMWLMDQVTRILLDTPVINTVAKWENGYSENRFRTGSPSKKYLSWVKMLESEGIVYDTGIAP